MNDFEELSRITKIANISSPHLKVSSLGDIKVKNSNLPILSFCVGPDDPSLPTFGLFGGVHGLEKVGTHIVLYYLESLLQQLKWDENLQKQFKSMRLVSIPMINPAGVYLKTRSNGNGVDLMRNAPVESTEKVPYLIGGQSYSNRLPWYRGDTNNMETETLAVINFVKKEMFSSTFSMALDIHSGFGLRDRLWYPYAKTKKPFPLEPTALSFKNLIDKAHPFHVYKVEPQSHSYTTHGDLWDYLFDM
ncbi:MAG: zinc carboxypeptidase, partial [Bdellovibrionales bacterium]|nr:zinc carboxypeptidase [Bdellovibrionales bacterium]